MPKYIKLYLENGHLRTHFGRALALGFILRVLSAFFVYGPQALDDYKHGVWPAYQYFSGIPLTDYPGYRSQLLVWLLSAFVHVGSWFGVSSALGQVRAMYLGLGLISLLAIVGTYLYARATDSRLAGRLMLYLIAAYPLIPFVSTRAFGESVSLGFVTLGFGVLEFARLKRPRWLSWWSFGFICLGVGTLFRFQVGVLFVAYAVLMLRSHLGAALLSSLGAGVLTLIAQAFIDLNSGRVPMGTLFNYLAENEGGGAKYGVSPWWNTWALALGILFIPFSLVFWRHARAIWRHQWPVISSLFVFVLVHSAAAHKEERFLYPTLGLEIWVLACFWASGARDVWARRVFAPVFFTVAGLGLIVSCLINSQVGEIGPPADVERQFKNVTYLDAASLFGQSKFQFYFLRPPSVLKAVEAGDLKAERVDAEVAEGRDAVVLITSDAKMRAPLEALANQKTARAQCGEVQRAQSPIDALLFRLNPRHNQRRRPTWYVICARGADA